MGKRNRYEEYDHDETGDIMSWVIVFILMVAFWPIGLLMLLRKLNILTKSASSASKRKPDNYSREDGVEHDAFMDGAKAAEAARDAVRTAENAARDAAREAENVAREVAADLAHAAREAGYSARRVVSDWYYDLTREYPEAESSQADAAKSETPKSQSTRTGASPSYKTKAKIKKERTALEKKTGRPVSVILLLISIALFILGANTMARAAHDIWWNDLNRWPEFYLGAFYFIGGLISFFSRNISVKRYARYKRYYVFVSERDIVPMPEIARAAGLSVRVVKRDIQAMINEGYLPRDAYIDKEHNCLVLSASAAEELRQTANNDEDMSAPTDDSKAENQYMAIILELREINYSITDMSISKKVDRIEEVTAMIFRIVEENPEKLPQIRRFLNYYLPTTIKLLRSYVTLEKQGIKGENITTTKESIGRILDTLATGFEQQFDQLFKDEALDIAADINVLENLMQQDGLTG